jgi:hypothetical protein
MIKRDKFGRFIKGNYSGKRFENGYHNSVETEFKVGNKLYEHINSINTRFKPGCKNRSISGEKHHNWRGGKSRYGQKHRIWSKHILEKYGYTCQNCLNVGGKLNAHHIINVSSDKSKRYYKRNGICLCKNCHYMFHKIYGFMNNNRKQIKEFISHKNNPLRTAVDL